MSAKHLNLPDTASVAIPDDNGKLHAPSAARNVAAILQAIRPFVPSNGNALEIASGTGEHMMRYAAALPNLTWQPTDIDQTRLDSIAAWSDDANLSNILAPKLLDATVGGWASEYAGKNLIILSNLLHLISVSKAETVIAQSAEALAGGGIFLIYGPFLRSTKFASEGDRKFHESLCGQDSEIGYKSFQFTQNAQTAAGLSVLDAIEMPANNLLLVAQKM